MAVDPTGIFSLPLTRMRDLLAACESFQEWAGVDAEDIGTAEGVTEAAGHIHLAAFEDARRTSSESEAQFRSRRAGNRPLAVVGFESGVSGSEDSVDAAYWHHSGDLTVLFETVTAQAADADAIVELANSVGAVVEEIESTNGGSGYLKVTDWTLRDGPGRMSPEDVTAGQLDLVAMRLQISWDEI